MKFSNQKKEIWYDRTYKKYENIFLQEFILINDLELKNICEKKISIEYTKYTTGYNHEITRIKNEYLSQNKMITKELLNNKVKDKIRKDIMLFTDEDAIEFGKMIANEGFTSFFLCWFNLIINDFIYEEYHKNLFDYFENVMGLNPEYTFSILNLCPRSCKTEMSCFALCYIPCICDMSNSMYVSFSNNLIKDMSLKIKNIFENKIFKKCYSYITKDKITEEIDYSIDAPDWENNGEEKFIGIEEKIKKNIYSYSNIKIGNHNIKMNVLNGQITGQGVGIRSLNQKLDGILIIDDPHKVLDTFTSTILTEKVFENFKQTLMSRRNNNWTPYCILMQRLSIFDLTARLQEFYDTLFKTIKSPLEIDGICQLPSKYSKRDIENLKLDNLTWMAQYQQEPQTNILRPIDIGLFNEYRELPTNIKQFFITGDTAFSTKETADESVFCLFAIDEHNKCYIIDTIGGHYDMPTLKRELVSFYLKWNLLIQEKYDNSISKIFIEDKGSGISLIQEIRSSNTIYLPIDNISPTLTNKIIEKEYKINADKRSRALECQIALKNGFYFLPIEDETNKMWCKKIKKQCFNFTGLNKHEHDDYVDACFIYPLKVRQNCYGFSDVSTIDYEEINKKFDEELLCLQNELL